MKFAILVQDPQVSAVEFAKSLNAQGLRMSSQVGPKGQLYAEKVHLAKQFLGPKLVTHPAYTPIPRHSTNPAVYGPARAGYLQLVSNAAKYSRTSRHN